jgi:hypothetical protein
MFLSATFIGVVAYHNCSCDSFCSGSCSFHAGGSTNESIVTNITMYRFTPRSVLHLENTNTGDALGDLGFFFDRRALQARCALDPTNERCFLAPWNALFFARWLVEVDTRMGPYFSCEPAYMNKQGSAWDLNRYLCSQDCVLPPFCSSVHHNGSRNTGDGQLTCFCARANQTVGVLPLKDTHAPPHPPRLPRECAYGYLPPPPKHRFTGSVLRRINSTGKDQIAVLQQCCEECFVDKSCTGYELVTTTRDTPARDTPARDSTAATIVTTTTSSTRADRGDRGMSTGFECMLLQGNLSTVVSANHSQFVTSAALDPLPGGGWNWGYKMGGNWYSLPEQGKCKSGARPGGPGGGDTSGGVPCTWRVVGPPRLVESKCIMERVDRVVETHAHDCLARCANKTRLLTRSEELGQFLSSGPVAHLSAHTATAAPSAPSAANRSSDCYFHCYWAAVGGAGYTPAAGVTNELLLEPFVRAFAHPELGGCPLPQRLAA